MSLYDEITADLAQDIYDDLPELVVNLSLKELGSSTYNPTTGMSAPEVLSNFTIDAIKLKDIVGEVMDEPTRRDIKQYIILNQHLGLNKLKENMTVDDTHTIISVDTDPTNATHLVSCRLSKN